MTAGGVDIIEQGPRGPRRAGIAVLVALAAVPFIVILASRDTSRPAPEPPVPVREMITVRPNAVYPAASGTGGTRTMRVTFPDGSRAELTYPAGLNLASLGARPYASGTLTGDGTSEGPRFPTGTGTGTGAGEGAGGDAGGDGDAGGNGDGNGDGDRDSGGGGEFRSLTAPLYGEAETAAGRPMIRHLTGDVTLWPGPLGVDTAGPVLLFAFGDWRIALQDERAGMTFEQRLAWARNLRGTLTPGGFLTLSAGGPLRLSRPGEIRDGVLVGPQLWLGGLSRRMLVLAPVPACERQRRASVALDPRHTISGTACRAGFYLAASGDESFVRSALRDVRVRAL
ncbi:hypothetical protein [Nonomuraea jabiensis]|uniref:Uncharacterized protein n=1 Tax=Nonomuraea jabiensis TaxID=882448 RepID=A0A7W9LE22_9ACTN|nr:hypothetical protein [Nonomuraea jabiensis]MBB5780387.1 hypothetical protein [Nonomuraea jabiensis]